MAKVMLKNSDRVINNQLRIASSFFDRLVGLMFSKEMKGFDGLLIKHCQSIHTCFMRYPIDVVFLDSKYKIVKVIRNMKPWRISFFYWRATQVLELPAGRLDQSITAGMELEVKCTN